jgi:hypothetical protein
MEVLRREETRRGPWPSPAVIRLSWKPSMIIKQEWWVKIYFQNQTFFYPNRSTYRQVFYNSGMKIQVDRLIDVQNCFLRNKTILFQTI